VLIGPAPACLLSQGRFRASPSPVYLLTKMCFSLFFACAAAEVPLQITSPLQDQEVLEKQEATFVCEVSKPNQTARWLRNGVEVVAGGRYEVKVEDTRHSLVIKEAEKSDEAQYSVAFSADLSSAAALTVTGNIY